MPDTASDNIDTSPFIFTANGNPFTWNPADQEFEGVGSISISLEGDPGVELITINDATAEYNGNVFSVSGSVMYDQGEISMPLFYGSFSISYLTNTSSFGILTSNLSDDNDQSGVYEIAGLMLQYNALLFNAFPDSDVVFADVNISLPFTSGSLEFHLDSTMFHGVGLAFTSGYEGGIGTRIWFGGNPVQIGSNVVNVFGIFNGISTNQSFGYDFDNDMLEFSSQFDVSSVFGSSISANTSLNITYTNGVPSFVGSLTISGLSVPSDSNLKGFGINEIDLSVNTATETLTGGIDFTFPFGGHVSSGYVSITAAWASGFTVTDVHVGFTDLGIVIPDTPDFVWQDASVDVSNMFTPSAPVTFSGSLGFSFGPQIGDTSIGSLTVTGSGSSQQLTGSEQIQIIPYSLATSLVGGVLDGLQSIFPLLDSTGTVTATYSPAGGGFQKFSFVGTTTILGGFITTSQNFTVDADFDFKMYGQASVNFNNSVFSKISNYSRTATANYFISYASDASLSSDFAEAWFTTSVGFLSFSTNFTVGLRVNFDGTVSTLLTVPNPVTGAALSHSELPTSSALVAGAMSDSSPNYLFLTASWTSAATQPVSLTVTNPNGTVIQQADFATNNIAVVSALSTAYSETVVVLAPGATAGWGVAVANPGGLGTVTTSSTTPNTPPTIESLAVSQVNADGSLAVSYSLANTGGDSTISFFADQDGENFDGVQLGQNIDPVDGTGATNLSLSGLSEGLWHIYALVSDGTNIPAEVYAASTVSISSGLRAFAGAPEASTAPNFSAANGATVTIPFSSLTSLVSNDDPADLSIVSAALNNSAAGSIAVSQANSDIVFTPAAGYSGSAAVQVTIGDAVGNSVVQPLELNVVVQASAPVVVQPNTTTTTVNGNVTTIQTFSPAGALISTETIAVNDGVTQSQYFNASGAQYQATIQTVAGNETQFQTFDGDWNQQSASITFNEGGGDTVVQNFNGSWVQTGAVVTTVNGASTIVQNFSPSWVQTSATITTVSGNLTETQNFDANWNQTSAILSFNLGGGTVETQYFDAHWNQTSATYTTVRSDQTETQDFNANWVQTGATIVTLSGGQTTTQIFDANWNQLSATIDTPNPTTGLLDRFDTYNGQWQQTGETDTALNGGVSYYVNGTPGGGQSFTASTAHSTTFIFTPGSLAGDSIAGLHTLNLGGAIHDVIDFEGYGAGAQLTQVNSTEWQVLSTNNPTETFTLTGGSVLGDGDYAFVASGVSGDSVSSERAGSGAITVTDNPDITPSSVGIVAKPATTGGQVVAGAVTTQAVTLFSQFAAAGSQTASSVGGALMAVAAMPEPVRLAAPSLLN